MTIASSGEAGLNQYPVNYQLMRQLLLTAKERAPFFAPATPGMLSKNAGTASVRWERIENLTAVTSALTEDSGTLALPVRQGVVPSITQLDATMAKYGNVIYVTEELDLMSVNARSTKFMTTLGINVGDSYNAIMEAVYSAGVTSVRLGGGVGSAASIVTAMSANDIKFAHAELNRNGAMKYQPDVFGSTNIGSSPVRASYLGICHTDVSEDIRAISGFISVEQYGGYTNTYPFEIGAVGGVRWVETELSTLIEDDAATTSASGFRGTSDILNDVYDSYIVGMDAIGSVGLGEMHTKEIYQSGDRLPAVEMIQHAAGSSGIGDPLNEITSIGWKGWLVGKVLNTNWAYKIRTLASDFS